ncbi:hypothetical protein [Haladaptatus sp. ZSTT2]|uniref:hypothetical protein n=1 Tax=Haladaptatus sp. ZSTT2 TaxID=3120515 RepID=UPI00300F049F
MADKQVDDISKDRNINRRTMIRAIGVTSVGLSGLAGVASAGEVKEKGLLYNFYGCSQVCVNKKKVDGKKVKAVVWTGKDFDYRYIYQSSNRNDPPVRDWKNVYCSAVKNSKEAIVGIRFGHTFIENPNRCAQNYPKPGGSIL